MWREGRGGGGANKETFHIRVRRSPVVRARRLSSSTKMLGEAKQGGGELHVTPFYAQSGRPCMSGGIRKGGRGRGMGTEPCLHRSRQA